MLERRRRIRRMGRIGKRKVVLLEGEIIVIMEMVIIISRSKPP